MRSQSTEDGGIHPQWVVAANGQDSSSSSSSPPTFFFFFFFFFSSSSYPILLESSSGPSFPTFLPSGEDLEQLVGNSGRLEEVTRVVMPMDQGLLPVVAIECAAGSSKADEWREDMLQTGDIVQEIRIGDNPIVARSPFKNGKTGIKKLLRDSYKRGDTSIVVQARRGTEDFVELQACIVPHESGSGRKSSYVLRSIHDPNYAIGFVDRLENECLEVQGTRSSRVATALSMHQLQDGYVSYPWEKKIRESLPVPGSSSLLSILFFPKAIDAIHSRYNSLEDTLARAHTWLRSSQAYGVPIVFMNVQSEALLTKISGETASSTVNSGSLSDIVNLANASLYGFEDYHGVDIGVMKAVRLWYTPVAGEFPVEIEIVEGDAKLGFSISRTEEGFIYISSVEDEGSGDLPSSRSGLRDLYREAERESRLLVISRVSNEKVLPWLVSPTGAIRCFDTLSISHKLSLHRHALRPILIHLLMWERQQMPSPAVRGILAPPTLSAEELIRSISLTDRSGATLARDAAGEASFRFLQV